MVIDGDWGWLIVMNGDEWWLMAIIYDYIRIFWLMGLLKVMYYFPNGGRNVGKHQSSNPIFGFPRTMVFLIFLCSCREAKQAGCILWSSWIILDHHPGVCSLLSMMKWVHRLRSLQHGQVPGNCQAAREITDTLYIYIFITIHIIGMNILWTYTTHAMFGAFWHFSHLAATEARRWRCGCRRTGPSMLLGASQRRVSPKDSRRHGIYHWYMIYRSQDCYIPIFHWFKIVISPSFIDLPTKMS